MTEEICRNIRKEILKISRKTGHGHIPTCYSIIEVLYAVYSVMNHNPKNPKWSDRDIFVLSKGHASLAQYCVLAYFGYFDIKDVYTFGCFGSNFGCHSDRLKIPGIEVSTGSLGHGIGVAVGIALSFKIQNSSRKVFTLIGDGESNEGSVWESLLAASSLNLSNLTVIYDDNRSHERGLQITNPSEKLKAFGCDITVVKGHNVEELKNALKKPSPSIKAVVAETIKGCGSRTMARNHYEWHRRSPTEQEFNEIIKELDEKTI